MTVTIPSPSWLDAWRASSLDKAAALAHFDRLPSAPLDSMLGRWRGSGLPTGHPMDGLLERYGWAGKTFRNADAVDPLLFMTSAGALVALDPKFAPAGLLARPPALAHTELAARIFRIVLPLVRTARPTARLRAIEHRGVVSAAMVYDALPIIDHFRIIDERNVLGLMDLRNSAPFFFSLSREDESRE